MSDLASQIKETIIATLPDADVYVADPDGEHFEAIVISASFESLPLVKQHQTVMKALKTKFETTVHSLALKTFTPAKWDAQKHNYSIK